MSDAALWIFLAALFAALIWRGADERAHIQACVERAHPAPAPVDVQRAAWVACEAMIDGDEVPE